MQEWISSTINADHAGAAILVAALLLGAISVFTCACNFAVIGVMSSYAGSMGAMGRTKTVVASSAFFLLGVAVTMSAVGFLLGFAGEQVSMASGRYWRIGAGVIAILFGAYTLDILPFKVASISPGFQGSKGGVAGAVLFGFGMGIATSLSNLCFNPVFPIVMGASLLKGSTLWGAAMLLCYALGYGATLAAGMLGVGLGVGKIAKLLSRFAVVVRYIGGITLIALGFYFLVTF